VKNCLTSGRSLQVAAISAIGTRTKLATWHTTHFGENNSVARRCRELTTLPPVLSTYRTCPVPAAEEDNHRYCSATLP
jgi:hypothetical protein